MASPSTSSTRSAPTVEIGSILPERPFGPSVPGWSVFEAQRETFPVAATRWPLSNFTYEDMRRDPQIQGLLNSVFLPIQHMEPYVDPAGTTGTVAEEIAQDLGLPVGDEDLPLVTDGVDFGDHIRMALLALAGGHRYFEESGVIDEQGKYRLTTLADRPPTTINRIDIEPSGALTSITQRGALPPPVIPADRLVPYVWNREGANWAGRPLLYGLYRSWLLKDELIRGDAVTHRRFSGVPYMETTQPGVVDDEAQAAAALIMQSLRSGDTSGFTTPYGMKPHILGVEGSLPDAIKSVVYHDQQMARAFMQMFAELGQQGRGGSRALGLTLIDHFEQGVMAIVAWLQKTVMQLVSRIVWRNYGPDVPIPVVRFRLDDHEEITITELVAAVDSGLIVVDDDLEEAIRDRKDLPPRNPAEAGRVPPTAQPPVQQTTAGERVKRPDKASAATDPPSTQAQTDFPALQATYEQALATLTASWAGIQAAQIADLTAQVSTAVTITDLAAITPTVLGAGLLLKTLEDVLAHGAQTAVDEAAAQGATLPVPDLQPAQAVLSSAVDAVAALLARELGESAASKAVALHGGGQTMDTIATHVGEYLDGLAGATPAYEIAGLVSRAQNEGRLTAMEAAPEETHFYSSELNDTNTCPLCEHEDGKEFPSIADARKDYPAGGYFACEGGNRCRGTVVAIYAETPGQVA